MISFLLNQITLYRWHTENSSDATLIFSSFKLLKRRKFQNKIFLKAKTASSPAHPLVIPSYKGLSLNTGKPGEIGN